MGSQQFCLKWNNHQVNITDTFENLLENDCFVDVSLACGGNIIKAHKIILSACSPFLKNILNDNPCQHPVIILNNMNFAVIKALITFMYKGEVNISQDQLSTLLKTAEALQIKGLTDISDQNQLSANKSSNSQSSKNILKDGISNSTKNKNENLIKTSSTVSTTLDSITSISKHKLYGKPFASEYKSETMESPSFDEKAQYQSNFQFKFDDPVSIISSNGPEFLITDPSMKLKSMKDQRNKTSPPHYQPDITHHKPCIIEPIIVEYSMTDQKNYDKLENMDHNSSDKNSAITANNTSQSPLLGELLNPNKNNDDPSTYNDGASCSSDVPNNSSEDQQKNHLKDMKSENKIKNDLLVGRKKLKKRERKPCPQCFKLLSKHNMSTHVRYVHGSREASFQCHICHRSFSWKTTLYKHLYVEHKAPKQYRCSFCGRLFDLGRLILHLEKEHNIVATPEQCGIQHRD
ncbi:Protein bric-a-brac 1 [Nymphon striatum]|nr:Protein bric-a-brac 1 [Nymphon striatum]